MICKFALIVCGCIAHLAIASAVQPGEENEPPESPEGTAPLQEDAEDIPFELEHTDDPMLEWLLNRSINIRVVKTANGDLLLPVYVAKSVELKRVDKDTFPELGGQVVVKLTNLLAIAETRELIVSQLESKPTIKNLRIATIPNKKVRVELQIRRMGPPEPVGKPDSFLPISTQKDYTLTYGLIEDEEAQFNRPNLELYLQIDEAFTVKGQTFRHSLSLQELYGNKLPAFKNEIDKRLDQLSKDLFSTNIRLAAAEKRLKAIDGQLAKFTVQANPDTGFLRIGDELLICWGHALLPASSPSSSHTRSFKFQFAQDFATKPTVTTGFNQPPPNSGYVFGLYRSTLDNKQFTGYVFDNKTNSNDNVEVNNLQIEMSYYAIGKPKNK